MRLICPNCLKTVEVGDDLAGKDVECGACGKAFAAPSRYDPVVAVDPPPAPPPPPPPTPPPVAPEPHVAPPPGYVPPAERTLPGSPAAPAAPLPPGSYAHAVGFDIPRVLFDWLPAGCLVVILLLSLFTWTGIYPAGYTAYYQTPWRMAFGLVGLDPTSALENELKLAGDLKKLTPANWLLMLPYLLCLLAATGLAVAERVVRNPTLGPLPPRLTWLGRVWPYRLQTIAVLGCVMLACVFAQAATGFGLERALKDYARGKFADPWAKAGDSEAERFKVEVQESMFVGQYHPERTTAYAAAVWLNALALFGLAARVRFDRRGEAPPPRVTIQY